MHPDDPEQDGPPSPSDPRGAGPYDLGPATWSLARSGGARIRRPPTRPEKRESGPPGPCRRRLDASCGPWYELAGLRGPLEDSLEEARARLRRLLGDLD